MSSAQTVELNPQDYPQLWKVSNLPERLFARSLPQSLTCLRELPERGLAVVGTRRPQQRSLSFARGVLRSLQGSALVIVSGLAAGVDACAHEAAVESGLPTIAVLGSGVERVYPAQNEGLAARIIARGGVLISEFAPDEKPRAFHFIQRNRLIAGWTTATWVVEAAHRSGALNTARWARDQNRVTFATPSFPGDSTLAGAQGLIDDHHAHPLWGSHSLGCVWLELAARKRKWKPQPHEENLPDDGRLAARVARLTTQQGAARVPDLLDWSVDLGWGPEKFFQTLQACLVSGQIRDKNGLLVAGP